MTLCVAWVRQDNENQELIFATDSMLTGGGETWKHGIKLFELPRKDCLLCFAGDTSRAYPLFLNLTSSMKFDQKMLNQHTDLRQVLEYLCDAFTELINDLKVEIQGSGENPYATAKFIFGGWNWRLRKFEFWEIYYSDDEKRFLYAGHTSDEHRPYIMIGDHVPEAEDILLQELTAAGKKIQGTLDMEPFIVLSKMARDATNYRSIDGSLQVAKVYTSSTTEFFGVMWPSVNGKSTFLGKELNQYLKPQIRFIDPDSGSILDLELPLKITKLDPQIASIIKKKDFGNEEGFIDECYPEGELKPDLTDKQKEMLLAIFRDNSYKSFLSSLSETAESIGD